MHTRRVRAARAIVALGLAIAGYLLFIQMTTVNRSLMHQLVIEHTSVSGLEGRQPALSQAVPPSKSAFPVMQRAARTDPHHTGLYEREWYLNPSGPPEAGILLQLLPDPRQAQAALVDSEKQLSKPPTLQGQTASSPTTFTVPSVPGARGISYALNQAGTPTGTTFLVAFRVGSAVVSELVAAPAIGGHPSAPPIKDAQDQHALLVRRVPGFSMTQARFPLVASIVYWVVALTLVLAAFGGPEWAVAASARRRQRREAKQRERERSEYRARGRRAVQRHRAPAWRQPSRR